jgi:hypothetical protein
MPAVIRRLDPWLLAVLVVSAALCLYKINWGLPNGNFSWAADALGPLTVLSIARRSAGSWNSGWFWYKYPPSYPMILLLAYAPYLGILVVTGQVRHPSTSYPYGLAHPETVLYVLALIGRCVSAAMIVTSVALTFDIGRRLLSRTAGLLAAWFVATAYPLIYYAHTTNQDGAYYFWLVLALWATVVATESERRRSYVILGIAAAMAMATKEQGFGFLLGLPVLIVVFRHRAADARQSVRPGWWAAVWNPATHAGLLAAAVTTVIANNLLVNPRGMVNRLLDLTGRPVPGLSSRLTPLRFSLFKGVPKEWWYLRQLVDAMESTFGLTLFLVVVVGLFYMLWSRSRAAACLLLPAAAYYALSLRTHELLALRYALPLIPIFALSAAAVCAAALRRSPRLAGAVVAALCILALARAVELNLLLSHDARYAAEEWMHVHAPAGSVVEIYQKPVYLPRLDGLAARAVPLGERTVDGVLRRRTDYIVTSSAGRKQITHRWNRDWHNGLLGVEPSAAAFLEALESGRLPYRRVAHFEEKPVLLRLRITSLSPEISIYQRVGQ